jgi:4-amino-4-deoxy-L-arabinose transferase-like glycosyltransferase
MTNSFFEKNIKLIFLLILILGIILRTEYLDKSFQKDEISLIWPAKNILEKGIPLFSENYLFDHAKFSKTFCRSPAYLLYLSGIMDFISTNEAIIRLSIVAFSVLTIILIFFVGEMLGGKKVGLLSSFLLVINRLHVEHSQIIDVDGSILTFLVLLAVFFLMRWWKFKKEKYLFYSILTISIGLLFKEPILLIFPALFIYSYKRKELQKAFAVFVSSLSIFVFFMLLFEYIYSTDFLDCSIRWVNSFVFHTLYVSQAPWGGGVVYRLYQFIGISSWDITPPMIILFLISLIHTLKAKRNAYSFLVYFSIIFTLFYIGVLGVTRYFVPLIPTVCILIATYCLDLKIINSKSIVVILLIASIIFSSFYLLRMRTDILFLNDIKANYKLIAIPYILSLIPLPFYFSRYRRFAILFLLGLYIGFNIYFAQESINPLISPDYGRVSVNAANFVNKYTTGPVVTDIDIAYYSKRPFYDIIIPFVSAQYLKNLATEIKPLYVVYRTNSLVIQPGVEDFLGSSCLKIGGETSRNVEIFKAYKC